VGFLKLKDQFPGLLVFRCVYNTIVSVQSGSSLV